MWTRIAVCGVGLTLLSGSWAFAAPAYVKSTVNLRAAAGTTNEIVAKIPAGSLVDAANCAEWCEIEWQGKKGFAIATALDTSGRVPVPSRPRMRTADVTGSVPGPVVTGPPVVMYGPPVYYPAPYPYAYGWYGPRRYYGYRRWRW
jgi:uncharacterized protein YraI